MLSTVEAVAGTGAPVLVMTYWNPVERYGVDRFAADLAAAGGAGLITPDLVPDEADAWIAAADEHELDKVFLVAPSSTDERLAMTAAACRGFVYATAVMGVTGARERTSDLAGPLVARTKAVTDLPVGVGLGVSDGDQAAEVARHADGVIVGSAFVRVLLDAARPQGRAERPGRPDPRPRGGRTPCLSVSSRLALAAAFALSACSVGTPPSAEGPVADVSIQDDDGLNGAVLPDPYAAPDLPLTSTEGTDYRLDRGTAEAGDDVTLVFFGYTNCPDICQVVMADIASALTRLDDGQRDQVGMQFVTTDPARDDTAVAARLPRPVRPGVRAASPAPWRGSCGWATRSACRSRRATSCRPAATRSATAPRSSASCPTARRRSSGPRAPAPS